MLDLHVSPNERYALEESEVEWAAAEILRRMSTLEGVMPGIIGDVSYMHIKGAVHMYYLNPSSIEEEALPGNGLQDLYEALVELLSFEGQEHICDEVIPKQFKYLKILSRKNTPQNLIEIRSAVQASGEAIILGEMTGGLSSITPRYRARVSRFIAKHIKKSVEGVLRPIDVINAFGEQSFFELLRFDQEEIEKLFGPEDVVAVMISAARAEIYLETDVRYGTRQRLAEALPITLLLEKDPGQGPYLKVLN
jgi:hypothetical protein